MQPDQRECCHFDNGEWTLVSGLIGRLSNHGFAVCWREARSAEGSG